MNTQLWKKAWWLLFIPLLFWGFLPGLGDAAAPKTYTDKLGYFSFTPPPGWVEKDYPGEKVARVRFSLGEKATMSVAVRAAGPQEATFERILAAKRKRVAELRQERPQDKYGLQESTICGRKCVMLDLEFPGKLIQEHYLFTEKGLHVMFAYGAHNRENLEKYRKIAIDSFCTFKLKK